MLAVAVAGCGGSSNHTATSSDGGKRYGPACQHELVSAACVEEEAKRKPIEERDQKEQQRALGQEHEEVAKEAEEQEKESEGNSPIK